MIGQTVTVLPPITYDDNGDPVDGSGAAFDIAGCAVAPRFADETTDRGRQGVVIGYTVYAPPLAKPVSHLSTVRYRGVVYEIDGGVGDWFDPYQGIERGVQFALKRGKG